MALLYSVARSLASGRDAHLAMRNQLTVRFWPRDPKINMPAWVFCVSEGADLKFWVWPQDDFYELFNS